MGYIAKGEGYLEFATALSPLERSKVLNIIGDEFDNGDLRIEHGHTMVSVWSWDKYHEDIVVGILSQLTDQFEFYSGAIHYIGEDGELWQLVWKNGKWEEEPGYVIYESGPKKVYLYKEYNSILAYGEELIQVFANRDKAIELFNRRIEETFGMDVEDLRDNKDYPGVHVEDGYVCSENASGDMTYFVLEEKEVLW